MAIDPNSISPKDIKKLVVEGMVFQPDGGMRVERVKTSDDPVIAKQEMKALEDTATAWRKVHDFTKGMDDEAFARQQSEAVKLRDELLPYAKNRTQDSLNRAYAHIVADNFAQAAATLKDRMVQNMGFEKLETASLIIPQQPLPLTGGEGGTAPTAVRAGGAATPAMPECHIELPQAPDTQHWPEELKQAVRVMQTTQGATVLLHGEVSSELLAQAEVFISNAMPAKAREKVKEQFDAHRAVRQAMRAPAQLGLDFAAIPQLCLNLDGHLEVVERETLSSLGDWSLLDEQVQLAGFSITETVNSFEIDVNGAKVTYRHTDAQQLLLNETVSHTSQQDLIRWLDVEARQSDIGQAQMQAYLVKMVTRANGAMFPKPAAKRSKTPSAPACAKSTSNWAG